MSDLIDIEIDSHVADVRLNRPDKMNALNGAMFRALIETAEVIEANRDIRCVVLSGEGKAFCAGLDTDVFAGLVSGEAGTDALGFEPGNLAHRTHGLTNIPQQAVWAWHALRVPVIASLHGVAYGGGFQLALGADIRVAQEETKLSIMEIKWGIIPDMGATPLMRHLAREDDIRELTYTGRIFNAMEGRKMGFITHTQADPLSYAMMLAETIAEQNPNAIQAAKQMYNALPDSNEADALLTESALQDKLLGSPNQMEAVMAGLQKRAPKFED